MPARPDGWATTVDRAVWRISRSSSQEHRPDLYGLTSEIASRTRPDRSLSVLHSAATNTAAVLVDFNTTGRVRLGGYANHTLGTVALVVNYDKSDYQNELLALPAADSPRGHHAGSSSADRSAGASPARPASTTARQASDFARRRCQDRVRPSAA